ncbi:MAG: YebC/PmpR family DNA-binding transcriptional regulator [Candidatus Pacebacteria bacterium]|nr:YebC/PmpR family DNA-binding transcriptional regulator [Candidatus Paceibacterota bacterium]
MAGHSKWANIKHKKAAEDKQRAKIFSRIARKIRAAVKEGGSGDPDTNVALRPLLDKARAANMPNDNIQRAIDRGLGKGSSGSLQEILYEGYGPGGIGFMVLALTDNKNRTAAEVRNVFSKAGGSLGGPGSVKYMFNRGEEGDFICSMPLELTADQAEKVTDLVDELLELEDVEDVYTSLANSEDTAS